jgi:hypothetical protein
MGLGFFTMPIHPPGRHLSETLEEDCELALLAEEVGFSGGYIGAVLNLGDCAATGDRWGRS